MATIKELFGDQSYKLVNVSREFSVSGIASDSREVRKGNLFIALRGHERDGHRFIRDAFERGAACVCSTRLPKGLKGRRFVIVKDTSAALPVAASRFFGEPSKDLRFIGVTGTNGKTTTTHIVYEILKAAGLHPALLGSVKNKIGDKNAASTHTTPAPLELHSLLSEIRDRGCEYVIMEVSSHALKQSRTAGIDYDVAAMTNLTGDHLDYHLTMRDYAASKKMLFSSLKETAAAVLNKDDGSYREFARSTRAGVLSYGMRKKSDFTARGVETGVRGSRFLLDTPEGPIDVKTSLVGRYNVYNILAAAAISYALGIAPEVIKKAVAGFGGVDGRLEPVCLGQPFRIFVDYAHTHDALRNILTELRRFGGGDLVVVFGCGGNRDRSKRPKMGNIASRLADHVIITSDNPRKEDPELILDEIEKGFRRGFTSYERIADRFRAIERSLENRRPQDIVVIAGKGHEDCQIIGERSFRFNDREAVEEIIDVHRKRNNKSRGRKAAVRGSSRDGKRRIDR